jgi:hypothetical protein
MADYLPTSELAKAMLKLRRMVALSESFQAKLRGDYDAAFARVMYEGVPDEKQAAAEGEPVIEFGPWAAIWIVDSRWSAVAGGSQIHMRSSGQLHLYLMTPRDNSQNGWNNRRLEAIDFLEEWTADIAELSGADDDDPVIAGEGHLAINEIVIPDHQHVPVEMRASAGDFFFRHCAIAFGDDSGSGGA